MKHIQVTCEISQSDSFNKLIGQKGFGKFFDLLTLS